MRTRGLPILLLLAACSDGPPAPSAGPLIEAATVAPSPGNALGAVVTVTVPDADSVAVAFHLVSSDAGDEDSTAAVPVIAGQATVPVLGLLPASAYVLRPVAFGPGGTTEGEDLALTTDTLPSDLPRYVAGGPDPSPGYVAFAAGKYGLVIDNTGRVVWYRRFEPNGPSLNFQAQPNGRYVALPGTPDPADIEPFVEVDPLGTEMRRLGCARGLQPRFHDLLVEPDGGYWILCDETRTMDLTAVGGQPSARVTGTVVQHMSAGGALLFEWSPFDHFAITDLDAASRTGATVNWTHGNALDLAPDGTLLVSFRSLNEITGISTATGEVLWRLGGLRNQFAIANAPDPSFARQHGVRVVGPGQLQLLDNMGDPTGSHAERYEYDPGRRTARLARSYGSAPPVTAQLGGTTQGVPGDRILVAFGNAGRVEEYDAAGKVVWRIEGNPGYVFRAQRIRSLYRPGVGDPR
jgi:hypothetical protein